MAAATRRNNYEGTIQYRPDRAKKPYLAQITVQGSRLSATFRTKEEASKWIRENMQKADQGVQVDQGVARVVAAIQAWVQYNKNHWRPKTFQQNSHVVKDYLVPAIPPSLKVNETKPSHIRAILGRVENTGVGMRTIKYARTMMYGFFQSLRDEQVIIYNPVDPVKFTYLSTKKIEYLTLKEACTLIESSAGTALEHLWYLAIDTGMREGELLGLRWTDVDFANGCILVQNQLQWLYTEDNKGKQHYSFQPLKTDASRRRIALSPSTIDRLHQQKNRIILQQMLVRERWDEHNLVFPNSYGRPLEPTNVTRALRTALLKANVKLIRVHDLRHTCATLLLLANVNPKIVSERLGHSSVQITLNIYSHVIPTLQEWASTQMELMLNSSYKPETTCPVGAAVILERKLGGQK